MHNATEGLGDRGNRTEPASVELDVEVDRNLVRSDVRNAKGGTK
jgi:hypothetical protein